MRHLLGWSAALGLLLGSQGASAQPREPDAGAGASAPTSAPTASEIAAQLLSAVSVGAQQLGPGAEQVGTVRTGTLRQGQSRTFPMPLGAGRCYAVVSASSSSLRNIDATIEQGRTVLARDTSTDTNAVARHCASTAQARALARVRAFRGAGQFAVAIYALPSGAGAQVSAPDAAATTPGGTALERLAARAAVHAASAQAVTAPMREQAAAGQRVTRPVTLAPGRCYRILAASEDGVQDLDLSVLAPTGAELARDSTDDGVPTIGVLQPFCPAQAGTYQLLATVERGGGSFAMQVFGSGGAAAVGPARPVSRFRVGGAGSDFTATRLRARHQAVAPDAVPLTDFVSGNLRTNEAREIAFDVEAGRCYLVLGAGVPSMRELNVQVLDSFGNEMATDATTDAFPSARACPQVSGRWRATVRAFAGYGQFGAQVFSVSR